MVKLVTPSMSPLVMVVLTKFKSLEEVPTDPSIIAVVPSDLNILNHVAVPVAIAVAGVIELADIAPDDGVPKAVLFNGKLTNSV